MDTKTALLISAETAIRSRGFDAFSYADLSADVGIRKASIHHHFPTKAELGLSVLKRYSDAVFAHLDRLSIPENSAAERLGGYVRMYRDALSGGNTLCLCVALSVGRDSLSPQTLEGLNRFHTNSCAWLTDQFQLAQNDGSIRGSQEPAGEAIQCLALVEGAQLLAHAAHDPSRFDQATRHFLDRLG